MNPVPLLYFVTGTAQVPAYARDGAAPLLTRTPVDGPVPGVLGTLHAPCAGPAHIEYAPERQRWIRLEATPAGECWLGVETGADILPGSLARPQQRTGHPVTLGNGTVWEIPPARLALGGSGLPRRRVLGDDGSPVWAVEPAYQRLSAAAERLWNARQGLPEAITDVQLDEIVGDALSINYRLHSREAIALGLLTDNAVRGVVDALLDWPVVVQVLSDQKKSPPGT